MLFRRISSTQPNVILVVNSDISTRISFFDSELRDEFQKLLSDLQKSPIQVSGETSMNQEESIIDRNLADGRRFQVKVRKSFLNPDWKIDIYQFNSPEDLVKEALQENSENFNIVALVCLYLEKLAKLVGTANSLSKLIFLLLLIAGFAITALK